jgi:ATP-dependent Lon protease
MNGNDIEDYTGSIRFINNTIEKVIHLDEIPYHQVSIGFQLADRKSVQFVIWSKIALLNQRIKNNPEEHLDYISLLLGVLQESHSIATALQRHESPLLCSDSLLRSMIARRQRDEIVTPADLESWRKSARESITARQSSTDRPGLVIKRSCEDHGLELISTLSFEYETEESPEKPSVAPNEVDAVFGVEQNAGSKARAEIDEILDVLDGLGDLDDPTAESCPPPLNRLTSWIPGNCVDETTSDDITVPNLHGEDEIQKPKDSQPSLNDIITACFSDFIFQSMAAEETINNTPAQKKKLAEKVQIIDEDWIDKLTSLSADPKISSKDTERNQSIIQSIKNAGGPFRIRQSLQIHWRELMDQFDLLFPNFSEYSALVRSSLALNTLNQNRVKMPPILLVGPPGIGKTHATRWLAQQMDLTFQVIDMSDKENTFILSGSSSQYSNSEPGEVFKTLVLKKHANPIIFLDEIDKATSSDRGNPLSALHTLLEPISSHDFKDGSFPFLSINASYINWVTCANELERIPGTILSRLEIVQVKAPTFEHSKIIAKNIYAELRTSEEGYTWFDEFLCEETINALVAQSATPREIRRRIQSAMGEAVMADTPTLSEQHISMKTEVRKQNMGFIS